MIEKLSDSLFQPFDESSINLRQVWAANRFWMETENMKTKRYGGKGHQHWYLLLFLMKMLEWLIFLTGQYERGKRNAENIVLREIDLTFPNLPPEFESFTILHLADLHLDGMKGLERKVLKILGSREVDLCVLAGDYRTELHGPIKKVMESLNIMIKGIKSRHGFLGVLGNHDGCHMVAPMEEMGIRMLINESYSIHKNGASLQVIGTDDVHYYYSDQALHALEKTNSGFSIALVHSPELYDVASEMGIDLYLCGHTHAGQICLPGGIPFFKHLNKGKKYYKGHWVYRGMQGITHCGVGACGIPVRFGTRGELLILRLHKK